MRAARERASLRCRPVGDDQTKAMLSGLVPAASRGVGAVRVHGSRIETRLLLLGLGAMVAILGGCAMHLPPASPEEPRFPWPPPSASAEAKIPANWLPPAGGATRLFAVSDKLEQALRAAGYPKWSYSSVPRGFALVTQMEQIKADGTPSREPARWSTKLPSARELNFVEFIKALAGAPEGYYRAIVFLVTDQPWPRTAAAPTGGQAQRWLANGFNRLPSSIGELEYGPEYETVALIYEFSKQSETADATQVEPSATSAQEHLKKAGLYDPLSGWR
jgi:hypothetical protein